MDSSSQKRRSKNIITRKGMLILCLGFFLLTQNMFATQVTASAIEPSFHKDHQRLISVHFVNEPLSNVLHKLTRKIRVGISYQTKAMPHKMVTFQARKASIYTVLDSVLTGTGLYAALSQSRKVILIKKKPVQKNIQQNTITGTVTDVSTGEALPGVNILVIGTTTGTTTDSDGKFELTVESLQDTLRFSFIGYKVREIPIKGRTEINVALNATTTGLNEMVVTAYGVQKRENLTSSISTVEPDVVSAGTRSNIVESLNGNVTGLQASKNNGQPGAPVNVHIRGLGSINASSKPLYVIDGVPVSTSTGIDYYHYGGFTTSNLAGLNPEDIASVSVLKDAAATSIYGSRAANGVVVITTKKGKSGEARIHFSTQYGFNKMMITNGNHPLNANQMLELAKEGWANAGEDPTNFDNHLKKLGIDPMQNTNWMKALTRKGAFQKYNLSVSGGSEKAQYYVSGGYHDSQAIMKYLHYKRGTVMASIKSEPIKRLTINAKIEGHYQKTLNAQRRLGYAANPVRAIYETQPWIPIYNPDGSYNFGFNITYNPVAIINETKHDGVNTTTKANVKATLDIAKWLDLESTDAISIINGTTNMFFPANFGWGRNTNGRGYARTNNSKIWTTSNILRYNQAYGSKHNIGAYIGFEAQDYLQRGTFGHAIDFIPNLQNLSAASTPLEASSTSTEHSILGYFFHVDYNYNENYFLSISARRDGSSRFGAEKRYANFWSIGGGWSIKNTLLRDISFISSLKLRSSYGTSGNQEIGNFEAQALYGTGFNYAGSAGYVFSQFGNPTLTWEKNKPFNIGIDFGFLNERITGSLDYYERHTSSLLLNAPLPATSGLTSYNDNLGGMKNSGLEISLRSRNIGNGRDKDFSWNTNINISTLKNEVTSIPNKIITDLYIHEVGESYYTWYLPAYAGVDPQTGEKLYYSSKDKSQTSKNYKDAVRLKYGSSMPNLFGGVTNIFRFMDFSLSFLVYFSWGNKLYSNVGSSTNSDGAYLFNSNSALSPYTYEHRWQKPGDKTDVPKLVYNGPPSQRSSRWLADGSYARLKNLTFGYTLPKKLFRDNRIRNIKVYFRATNLFTYVKSNKLMYDPNQNSDGQIAFHTPAYKTFVFGLNIDF